MSEKKHVFEHLGKPPYKFAGYGELVFIVPGTGINKAGGSCDHCGSAIRHAFFLKSADGKTFKVGSLCVTKSGDKGLRKVIDAEVRRQKREKDKAELPLIKLELANIMSELEPVTSKMEHPFACFAKTKSYHDYLVYCAKNSSNGAIKKLIRILKNLKETK